MPTLQTEMHPILVDRKGKHADKDVGCEKVSSLNDLVAIAGGIREKRMSTVVNLKSN